MARTANMPVYAVPLFTDLKGERHFSYYGLVEEYDMGIVVALKKVGDGYELRRDVPSGIAVFPYDGRFKPYFSKLKPQDSIPVNVSLSPGIDESLDAMRVLKDGLLEAQEKLLASYT